MNLLLITPPFTQLNTPYPATAYLKGFLNTKGHNSRQADLGIEVILELFSSKGFKNIFQEIENKETELSENSNRIFQLRDNYIQTIDPAIRFLQNKNPTLAHSICDRTYLPEASRFTEMEDMEWAFGTMGTHDKARHLVTLYLEDMGDLIKEVIDPHFGFSRYAERLGMSASHFDDIHEALQEPDSIISTALKQLLETHIQIAKPEVLCISVPFPGNLFGALKCGQYVKANHPNIKIVMGGGYPNTELRRLAEERLFDYIDFVSLDDGEAPLMLLLQHLEGKLERSELKRVFAKTNGVVCYHNNTKVLDIAQRETGTPDYSDLILHDYLSVIEVVNPMHRLWSDGRWNKLTLAHGCYWGKCTFCDVSLDYIKHYEPLTPAMLCDRIETIIEQTGQNGFHFVDEAAPPALMRDLALEILRRKITVTWWTNIRFEKSFTPDLCRLLKASGCIAVSGGLEVASDRLLDLMKKGVTVAQVARVADAFTEAGIMVHAYLMYGFPTQTDQETIDALEMVRQLFESGVLQSGFWHRFAMTAHSPVGHAPAEYQVTDIGPSFGGFADNDRIHEDPTGTQHELYSEGLRKSLFNYMHGVCFEFNLSEWFDFDIPETRIPSDYIANCLEDLSEISPRQNAIVSWLNRPPEILELDEDSMLLNFHNKQTSWEAELDIDTAQWLIQALEKVGSSAETVITFKALKKDWEVFSDLSFEELEGTEIWEQLLESGLLIV